MSLYKYILSKKKLGKSPIGAPKPKTALIGILIKTVFLCIHSVYFFHFSKTICLANIVVFCIIDFSKKPRNWAHAPKYEFSKILSIYEENYLNLPFCLNYSIYKHRKIQHCLIGEISPWDGTIWAPKVRLLFPLFLIKLPDLAKLELPDRF